MESNRDMVQNAIDFLKTLSFVTAIFALTTGAAFADNYFGAIAYSRNSGAIGYSYDHASRSSAEGRAMNECRAKGRGCKVVLWFKNACGAVAGGSDGWGSGWGGNRQVAERQATNSCSNYSGGCRVLTWACTSGR